MERELVISCRMMHNLIKLHHVIKSYEQFHRLTTADGQTDRWTYTAIKVHTCESCNTV